MKHRTFARDGASFAMQPEVAAVEFSAWLQSCIEDIENILDDAGAPRPMVLGMSVWRLHTAVMLTIQFEEVIIEEVELEVAPTL